MKNDNDLFFTCSLIEFIGRQCKLERKVVVNHLGEECIRLMYDHACVLHCEPIATSADNYIELFDIPCGDFDNVAKCMYDVPDYWTIGEVYSRVIEDVMEDTKEDDVIKTLMELYNSWISDSISNYNSDFFYQSREYIFKCHKYNEILE